jgi:hypothetical protein
MVGVYRVSLAATCLVLSAVPALAVRPFITDDARVVGRRQAQMEMWVRGDRSAFQQWALTSYGPAEPLELTLGMVHGVHYEHDRQYSVAGPLMQAKYLFRKPSAGSWPGVAVSAGAFAPVGNGQFTPHGWDTFAYAAVTHSMSEGDGVLIHGNLGFVNSSIGGRKETWGVGSQVRVIGGFHAVGEVFSGDPYAESSGLAFQGGFRHFISEYIQIDATIGSGISGQPRLPLWGTVGLRLATPPLGRRVFNRLRSKR